VIVDLDSAVKLILLGVNDPLGLPFTAPACFQLEVNARDINLQVSILIEAEARSCSAIAILKRNVFINGFLHSRFIRAPLSIKFFWVVTHSPMYCRHKCLWIKHKLDAKFRIEVYKRLVCTSFISHCILSSDFGNHGESTIW